jgi:two-component system, cell cycle sensor histidine kinase and response regulator CckA
MDEAISRGAITPIVFITARGDYDLDFKAMSEGAADYLTKDELSAALLERSIRHAMERQRKREELIKAKRVIQALSESNDAVIHIEDEAELLNAICRIVVDMGGYRMAWVGYAEDDRDQTVTPVVRYGYEDDYLEAVKLTWKDTERGRGPVGTCIRTGIPSIIRSVGGQAEFAPWKAEALKRGYASAIGLPLILDSRRLGALAIYSSETDAFDTEEVEFLVKLSGNLSYGIGVLRLRKAQMQAEESLKEANVGLERRVGERTAELVKVNAKLRESEAYYRSLFDNMLNGFAYCRMLYEQDRPRDFIYLDVNSAFETLTGLKDVVGKKVSEVIPGLRESDPELFEIYARVALTGTPEQFETYVEALGMWFSISVYSPGKEHFVAVFDVITERKQAEEALRRSQRQLADIIEFIPDATIVINNEGTVIAWNRAMESMTEIPKNKMIGKGDFESSLPFYGSRRPILIDLLSASEEKRMEYYDSVSTVGGAIVAESYTPDAYGGKGAYLWGVATALFDEQGKVAGAIESIRDITERKLAEIALRESEERFSRFFLASPVATSITRLSDGYLADINDAFLDLFGYSREEVIGQDSLRLGMWANPEDRLRMVEVVHAQGRMKDFETRFRRKSGEILNVSLSVESIQIAGELYILALGYDITERKRAEEELLESENKFKSFAENALVGIYLLQDGVFKYVNPKFAQMFGYTVEECMNDMDYKSLVSTEDLTWVEEHVMKRVSGEVEFIHYAFRGLKKNGQSFHVEVYSSTSNYNGRPAATGTILDITARKRAEEERKKLEEQLFQSQKMESVGRLAGGVAHDFNNMLGVIIGRAEMALEQDVSSGKLQHNLKEILKAALRSADLTRQLLAFARKQTAIPKILDLNDTISGIIKMLRRLIAEDINLTWQPGLDLWKIKIDPSQVDQILANLVVNARDAISGTGAITLITENVVIDDSNRAETPEFIPGQYVLLTVSDTGAGMSREVRENIFEPFFTTKEAGKGTGLGLSTVYGIVKQNDGFIYVASEPGKGTTFRIYLPRFESETPQVPYEEAACKRPTGTETILLVEDDESILNLSRMILEELGYTVLATHTPADAIRLAERYSGDFHLLITDVVMPEMNGRELAEKVSAIRQNLKCLYMSGYTADVIAHHGILDEGLNFIQKPFGSDHLAAKVRQVLDHSE